MNVPFYFGVAPRPALTGVVLIVLALLAPGSALAQARRPERPYRAIFGSGIRPAERGQRMLMRGSAFGAYDNNLAGDQSPSPELLALQTGGYYTGATAGLEYDLTGRAISFGLDAGTSARYYRSLPDLSGFNPYASATLAVTAGKTTLTARQGVDYSPYYSLSFLPGFPTGLAPGEVGTGVEGMATTPAANRVALDQRRTYGIEAALSMAQRFGTRNSLTASYGKQRRDFRGTSGTDTSSWRGALTYRRQVARYAGLKLGYGREETNYGKSRGALERTRMHLIDIGADYRRPLSFSRRTLVDFQFGSTAIEGGPVTGRVYRAVADVGLTHEIGRTWQLAGRYHRGAGLLEGIAQPIFSDAVNLRLGGFASRRLEISAEGGYTEGEIGITGYRNPFNSTNGTARAQFALTPRLALFTDYLYYRYKFDGRQALPSRLPPVFNRQSVRAGLTLLLPVIR